MPYKCDREREETPYQGRLRNMPLGTLFYIKKPFSNVGIHYLCRYQGLDKGAVLGEVVEAYCTNPCRPESKGVVLRTRASACYLWKCHDTRHAPSCHWFKTLDNPLD